VSPFSSSQRSEFVLGLSLAEIILLLLFGILLVDVLNSVSTGGQDPYLQIASLQEKVSKLQEENSGLKSQLAALTKELQETKDRLEQVRQMIGAAGTTEQDVATAIQNIKRGHPVCAKDNTLLQVRIIKGELGVQFLTRNQELDTVLAAHHLVSGPGVPITNAKLDSFLKTLFAYEQNKRCRFDYRLYYFSNDDYHFAREVKFERYLYPEKMIQIKP